MSQPLDPKQVISAFQTECRDVRRGIDGDLTKVCLSAFATRHCWRKTEDCPVFIYDCWGSAFVKQQIQCSYCKLAFLMLPLLAHKYSYNVHGMLTPDM